MAPTDNESKTDKFQKLKSVVAAFGCAFFLSMASYGAKNVTGFNGMEVGGLRSVVILVFITPYVQCRYGLGSLRAVTSMKLPLLLRCIGSLVGIVCIYTGVRLIDLPDFTAIQYTYLILTAIAARMFLKEPFCWVKAVASLVAFLGVVMVTKPSLFAPREGTAAAAATAIFNVSTATTTHGKTDRLVGAGLAGISALASASVICLLRVLVSGERTLRNTAIVFCSAVFNLVALVVASAIFRGVTRTLPQVTNLSDWLYVLLASVASLLGQILMTYSLKASDASFVAIIRSSAIVFSFGFQAAISPQSVIGKNFVSYIGIVTIAISVCVVCIVDLRRKASK